MKTYFIIFGYAFTMWLIVWVMTWKDPRNVYKKYGNNNPLKEKKRDTLITAVIITILFIGIYLLVKYCPE